MDTLQAKRATSGMYAEACAKIHLLIYVLAGHRGSKDPNPESHLRKTPATLKTPRTPQSQKFQLAKVTMPSASETWNTYGDAHSKSILQAAINNEKYRNAAMQFHTRLFLIVRGLSVDEMHDMFLKTLPLFVVTNGSSDRLKANGIYEDCQKLVENCMIDRIQAYALMWLNSAEGLEYVRKYVHAK